MSPTSSASCWTASRSISDGLRILLVRFVPPRFGTNELLFLTTFISAKKPFFLEMSSVELENLDNEEREKMEQQQGSELNRVSVQATGETLFQQFLLDAAALRSDLLARTGSELPFLEVLALGVLTVSRAVAEKMQIPLRTQDDLLKLGPRVEYLLAVGLGWRYADTTAAAYAFKERVFDAGMKAVASLPRDKKLTDGLVTLFGGLTKDFFVDLLRASQEEAAELKKLSARIEGVNSPFPSTKMQYVDFSADKEYFDRVIEDLRLDRLTGKSSGVFVRRVNDTETNEKAEALRRSPTYGLVNKARQILRDIDMLRGLPVRPIPSDVIERTNAPSVEDHWIRTQMSLIGAGLPDAEFLLSESVEMVVALAGQCSVDDLVERFWQRMGERGCDVLSVRPRLEKKVRSLAEKTVYTGTCPFSEADKSTFLTKNDMGQLMTHREAVALAATGAASPFMERIQGNKQYTMVIIPNVIDWGTVTHLEFADMLVRGVIPYEVLLKKAVGMHSEQKKLLPVAFKAYDEEYRSSFILSHPAVMADIIRLAEKYGLPHVMLVREEDPFLGMTLQETVAQLPKIVSEWLIADAHAADEAPKKTEREKQIKRALRELDATDIAGLMARPDLREMFHRLFLRVLFGLERSTHSREFKNAQEWFQITLRRIPFELSTRYLLAGLAWARSCTYMIESPPRPPWIPQWEACFTSYVKSYEGMRWLAFPEILSYLSTVAGSGFDAMKHDIADHRIKEEDAYAWPLFSESETNSEHNAARETAVGQFILNRARYIQRATEAGMPDLFQEIEKEKRKTTPDLPKKKGIKKKK